MSTYRPHFYKTFDMSTIQIGGMEPELQIFKVSTKFFDALSLFVYFYQIVLNKSCKIWTKPVWEQIYN